MEPIVPTNKAAVAMSHPPSSQLCPQYFNPSGPDQGLLRLRSSHLSTTTSEESIFHPAICHIRSPRRLAHLSGVLSERCRFEELRTFRKCITEFALDPETPPTGFESFLWRYPVRIEIAIEYLGITPEEYTALFQGTPRNPVQR